MGCEKQLTVNRESFRNHTIAKIAGPLKVKENTCKADVRKCWEDGLALRLPLSEPREIYKDELATDNRSNIGSECSFGIDLPRKRDRSTIYRLNLIKLYRRKPELENLVLKNSSEGIDSETPYSGFVNGILETGGVMDKCVQMWTRNYGALGQTARVCFGVLCANRKKEEETRRPEKKKKSEREKEEKRAQKREGLIVGGRGEENPRVLLGDADQESGTRMRKNALRTGRRQAVELAVSKRGFHTGYRHGNY
ncbi:uncharacterized protein TNCV_2555101 [Trichonephila clavipes]|nr:uncharacterized protein TNCV_2555101 [Trichonephila clavipes]